MVHKQANDQPTERTYGLKPSETQLIRTTQQQMNALLSNIISMIAIERFAYMVSEKTSFKFNAAMTEVTVFEEPDQTDVPAEDTGVVGAE